MDDNDAEGSFAGAPPPSATPAQCRMRTQAQGESPSEEARYGETEPQLSNEDEEKMLPI